MRRSYIDETAWYQHGVLAWLWVMVNTTVAFQGAGKPEQGGVRGPDCALGRDFGQ
jgi:hypothetical protein